MMDLKSMSLSERILLHCDRLNENFVRKYGGVRKNIILQGEDLELYNSITGGRTSCSPIIRERLFRHVHAMYPVSYRRMILFGFHQYLYPFVSAYYKNISMYFHIHRNALIDKGYGEQSWEIHNEMGNRQSMIEEQAWGDVIATVDSFFTDPDSTPIVDIEMNTECQELLDDCDHFAVEEAEFPYFLKGVSEPYCVIPSTGYEKIMR